MTRARMGEREGLAVSPALNVVVPLRGEEMWRHFDDSVNAVSFGFVATAILISMFLVMAILERFLRTRHPFLSSDGSNTGARALGASTDPESQHEGFPARKIDRSLPKVRIAPNSFYRISC